MENSSILKSEEKERNSKYFKIIIPIVIILGIIIAFYVSWNTKKEISINIMDTSSSISSEIDKFIEENLNNPGVHTLKNDGYNYLLIVSEKTKATEVAVCLYDIYKYRSKINVEYEIEVNEDTISDSNDEKVQTMLVRFKENGDVNPVIKTMNN